MAKHIYLTINEKTELEQLIKSGKHPARVISHARILLKLDRSQGQTLSLREVAEAVMVSSGTVSRTKKNYFAGGLKEALFDHPRSGRPVSKMTGDVEAHLIALACSQPPDGYDKWSLRLLADELVALEVVSAISHTKVGTTLKKMNLSLGV